MKFNRILFASVVSTFIFASPCLAQDMNTPTNSGNGQGNTKNSVKKEELMENIPEKLTRDAINNLQKKPSNGSDGSNEQNNTEISAPHGSIGPEINSSDGQVQNNNQDKKEQSQTGEQSQKVEFKKSKKRESSSSSNTQKNNQEKPNNSGIKEKDQANSSVPLPEVYDNGLDDIKSKVSTKQDDDKKEYIVRGIISMLLVIAGAVLLVIVIIAGVNSGSRKSTRKRRRGKNYYDKNFNKEIK